LKLAHAIDVFIDNFKKHLDILITAITVIVVTTFTPFPRPTFILRLLRALKRDRETKPKRFDDAIAMRFVDFARESFALYVR